MNDNVENLILEHLRSIRGAIDKNTDELREVKERLTTVELGIAALRRESASSFDDSIRQQISIDKLKDRIDRIEKRLELAN